MKQVAVAWVLACACVRVLMNGTAVHITHSECSSLFVDRPPLFLAKIGRGGLPQEVGGAKNT